MAYDWLARLSIDELDVLASQPLSRQRSTSTPGKKAAAPSGKKETSAPGRKTAAPSGKGVAHKGVLKPSRPTRASATRKPIGARKAAVGRPVLGEDREESGFVRKGEVRASRLEDGGSRFTKEFIDGAPDDPSPRTIRARVGMEIRELICGRTRKCAGERKELSSLVSHSTTGVVASLATAIAPHVGLTVAVVLPAVAYGLKLVLKMGREVYCSTEPPPGVSSYRARAKK